jgi:hypothetical protein
MTKMTTNTQETKFRTLAPMAQVMHGLFGQFTVALAERSRNELGHRYGNVIDTDGRVIGPLMISLSWTWVSSTRFSPGSWMPTALC